MHITVASPKGDTFYEENMLASSVILDSDLIPRGISRKFVKFPGETQEHFYARVTHLHHQNQKGFFLHHPKERNEMKIINLLMTHFWLEHTRDS